MYIAVRVRGRLDIPAKTSETLDQLGLDARHTVAVYPETDAYEGRLNTVKDTVAYGSVDTDTAASLFETAGATLPDTVSYESFDDLFTNLENGDVTIGSLRDDGFSPTLRLSPPTKGFKDTKRQYGQGGSLGNWGSDITALLGRMT